MSNTKKVYLKRLPTGEVSAEVFGPDGRIAYTKELGIFTEEEYQALLDTITDEIAVSLDS